MKNGRNDQDLATSFGSGTLSGTSSSIHDQQENKRANYNHGPTEKDNVKCNVEIGHTIRYLL